MEQLSYFLSKLCGDIFKLLPMKEAEIELGVINHIPEYLENLIFNTKGALVTYPELKCEKSYLFVINNLNYPHENHSEHETDPCRHNIYKNTKF